MVAASLGKVLMPHWPTGSTVCTSELQINMASAAPRPPSTTFLSITDHLQEDLRGSPTSAALALGMRGSIGTQMQHQSQGREMGSYLRPNTCLSRVVVWAAGFLRIFCSSRPSIKNKPSSVLPTTYVSRSKLPARALPAGAV